MRDDPTDAQPAPRFGGHMEIASNESLICPFLRAIHEDVSLGDPIERPDQANRCTALGDAAPQSLRQQEFACLARAHVTCPRFVRGALLLVEPSQRGGGLQLTPAIVGALLVLAASFALSVGFVVANGGMNLPVAASGSPEAAVGTASPGASRSPAPSPDSSAAPPPSEGTGSSPEPTPVATPAATPPPTAEPTEAPTPRPSSDRYALLQACPDAPDCWVYVVRQGDNLVSIARYFGVPLDVVIERNPWTETTQLVADQELRLPPPTR